jgi:polysaccharide biosynthesis protein PslH
MKILWVKTDLLHPTDRGGQIRTLKILEQLHRRHEIHYLSFHDPANEEGPRRAGEYCSKWWPVTRVVPHRRSAKFVLEAVGNLASPLPLVISRYRSAAMQREFTRLRRQEGYDHVICDFLFPAVNLDPLGECVIFQHNVESMIWRRYVENAKDPVRRIYFKQQAERLWRFERDACRRAAQVIAVSDVDAGIMQQQFGVPGISAAPTGVDVEELTPREPQEARHDLVFVGSMDWMPNIDGITWFLDEILPRIRQRRPQTTVAVVGRKPPAALAARAKSEAGLHVTGTVPDIRPFLWQSSVSVVPLRVGSGTRLKIFEAMAARVPVVTTTIGAEGLVCDEGTVVRADTPDDFAAACLELLDDGQRRQCQVMKAWEMVQSRYSWDSASRVFEQILEQATSEGRARQ